MGEKKAKEKVHMEKEIEESDGRRMEHERGRKVRRLAVNKEKKVGMSKGNEEGGEWDMNRCKRVRRM